MTIDDGEVLHGGLDKARNFESRGGNRRRQDRVREWNQRAANAKQQGARQPALWASPAAHDFAPEPVFGQYPKGFSSWAARVLHAQPDQVLHVCSGALPRGHGVRVDIRQAARPDVRADGRVLPFRDASFRAVAIDPPYTAEYAKDLYGIEYPRPSALLREAARVVVPGGRVGLLHFFVPSPVPGLCFVRVYGITTGCGYRIRAFTTRNVIPFESVNIDYVLNLASDTCRDIVAAVNHWGSLRDDGMSPIEAARTVFPMAGLFNGQCFNGFRPCDMAPLCGTPGREAAIISTGFRQRTYKADLPPEIQNE